MPSTTLSVPRPVPSVKCERRILSSARQNVSTLPSGSRCRAIHAPREAAGSARKVCPSKSRCVDQTTGKKFVTSSIKCVFSRYVPTELRATIARSLELAQRHSQALTKTLKINSPRLWDLSVMPPMLGGGTEAPFGTLTVLFHTFADSALVISRFGGQWPS